MRNQLRKPRPKPSDAVVTQARPDIPTLGGPALLPLGYMLRIMNDPRAPDARRDRMAIAAAPYVHPRIADRGARAQQAEAARQAGGADSEWQDDLDPTRPQ